LRQLLNTQGVKHDYAALFGRLVAEQLSDTSVQPLPTMHQTARQMTGSLEVLGRAEQHEQRKEWESRVFREASVDQAKLLQVVESNFGSEVATLKNHL